MTEYSFREIIVILRECYTQQRNQNNFQYNQDFWHVMDNISDELILKWAERASKIKNPVHCTWVPSEWMQLCNILHYMKTYDPYNQSKWTKSQKRFCTMMILNLWDDLEIDHYC